MFRASVALVLTAGLLAACSATSITTSDATTFWRQSVAQHYHGVVANGDGRGCATVSANQWSCTAYVRNAQNSLSSGIDVAGTVTNANGSLTVNAHQATGAQIQAWFSKYGGAQ